MPTDFHKDYMRKLHGILTNFYHLCKIMDWLSFSKEKQYTYDR